GSSVSTVENSTLGGRAVTCTWARAVYFAVWRLQSSSPPPVMMTARTAETTANGMRLLMGQLPARDSVSATLNNSCTCDSRTNASSHDIMSRRRQDRSRPSALESLQNLPVDYDRAGHGLASGFGGAFASSSLFRHCSALSFTSVAS